MAADDGRGRETAGIWTGWSHSGPVPGPGNPGRRRWHADRPADARERFERAWRMTEQLGASAEVSGETPESGAPDEVNQAGEVEDLAPAPDSGSDEKPAAGEFPAVVDARPAAVVTDGGTIRRQRTMVEPDERVRDVLWGARYLVVTRYMWPTRGVPRHQQLSAWAVVLRLETELIRRFQSLLPGLWERWDAGRRRQEMSLRVDRLRDVEREQEKLHLRRLAGWLLRRDEGRNKLLLCSQPSRTDGSWIGWCPRSVVGGCLASCLGAVSRSHKFAPATFAGSPRLSRPTASGLLAANLGDRSRTPVPAIWRLTHDDASAPFLELLNLSDGRRFLVLRPPPCLPARPFG